LLRYVLKRFTFLDDVNNVAFLKAEFVGVLCVVVEHRPALGNPRNIFTEITGHWQRRRRMMPPVPAPTTSPSHHQRHQQQL